VPVRLIDPPEVVKVDDGECEARVVSPGGHPLALQFLLEGPVVAEARQPITQRLGPGARVRVLEDHPRAVEPFRRLQDPPGQPDRQHAQEHRQHDDPDGGQHHGCALPERQPVDER
jgi:hypothetical protein